ncbi:RNA methyltransferase, SPOUT superfamily [Halorhabdus sp. SVX81]|uniref:RNA methyltransferase n=1 Tax=Halorhabdus sp. SVX81 TaxID=2978283 RepID=UPI0023DA8399|nr:RNA methyltransferase [Halorhabdus sp. SVX81]WEL18434.1 RNA methyltransferase, SPOUT superfamily [Halorhabdus sp. SVX81]
MTLNALVPSSLCREAEDKREATRKIGYVARAATVFRVDRLTVYPDPDGAGRWGDGFVETVLRYAATPPYLRKEAWDRRDELECVGVLPPLRVATQTGSGSDDSGSLRQGIVTEVGSDGRVRVNCGMQHPISLAVPGDRTIKEGERVTVRISSRRPVRAKIVDQPPPGYQVDRANLDAALSRPDAGVRIAASRHGQSLTTERLGRLVGTIASAGDMTVAFGAPERGLPAILGVEPGAVDPSSVDELAAAVDTGDGIRDAVTGSGSDGPRFDLWLNTVPNQGSEVVRTEEAMFATLGPLTLTE